MRLGAISLLLALLCHVQSASSESAKTARFRPALFGAGAKSLASQLECPFPRTVENNAVVFCQARIKATGKPHHSYCFVYEPEDYPYQRAANIAVRKSRFLPAAVDGKSVEVLFSFRVSFLLEGDVCSFAVIPNWGFDDEKIDLEHVAAQEIVEGRQTWGDRASPFTYLRESRGPGSTRLGVGPGTYSIGSGRSGIAFSLSVLVSEEGVPTDPRLEKNFFGSDKDIQRSLFAIQQSRFIPAFRDDRPISMRYFDVLFLNPD